MVGKNIVFDLFSPCVKLLYKESSPHTHKSAHKGLFDAQPSYRAKDKRVHIYGCTSHTHKQNESKLNVYALATANSSQIVPSLCSYTYIHIRSRDRQMERKNRGPLIKNYPLLIKRGCSFS